MSPIPFGRIRFGKTKAMLESKPQLDNVRTSIIDLDLMAIEIFNLFMILGLSILCFFFYLSFFVCVPIDGRARMMMFGFVCLVITCARR